MGCSCVSRILEQSQRFCAVAVLGGVARCRGGVLRDHQGVTVRSARWGVA